MEIPYQLGSAGKENAKSSMDIEGPLQYNNFLLECRLYKTGKLDVTRWVCG